MKKIFVFVLILLTFKSFSQVVSGRVGVFRDSIYLNGIWYSRLVGDLSSYTFNNLVIDSNFAVNSYDYRDDSYQYSSPFKVTMYGTNFSIQKYNRFKVDTFVLPYPVQVSNGKKYKIVFELCASGASFVIEFPDPSYNYVKVNCSACTQPQRGIIKVTAPYSGFSGYITIDIFQGRKFVLTMHIGGVGGSGVVGALPYWNSNSTLASSNMNFDGSGRIAVGSSSFDSTFSVVGSIHAKMYGSSANSGYLAVDRDANIYGDIRLANNLFISGGRVYVRIGNSVLTNDGRGADINLQGAIAASTFAVNTDSIVFRHLYTIQGRQSTPTVLYIYNQSGVNDTIQLPPINYVFNLGQNISASFLGSSYDILICNFTPSSVSKQVVIFPNTADSGATINGADSLVLPALSVRRFRGWVVGSNKVWLAY